MRPVRFLVRALLTEPLGSIILDGDGSKRWLRCSILWQDTVRAIFHPRESRGGTGICETSTRIAPARQAVVHSGPDREQETSGSSYGVETD